MSQKNTTTTNNATLLNLCTQYKLYHIYSPAPPRYDIASPYVPISDTNPNLLFTKEQLDMRRKVEILKYKSNQQNSKTNNPTKNGVWSFLSKQTSHSKVCRSNPFLYTPTTASDVPGPPIELHYDPTVPLYNYLSNRERIDDYSSSINIKTWSHKFQDDIEYTNKEVKTCFEIIYNNTRVGRTNYSFKTPIAINLQGTKNIYLGPLFASVHAIDIQLTNPKCIPCYGSIPTIPIGQLVTQLPTFNFKLILPNLGGDFLATKYIGDLSVSNLILLTSYQYVYNIKLSFDIAITLYDSVGNVITTQSDTTIYLSEVVANLIDANDTYYYNTYNCDFVDPSVPDFVAFDIVSKPPNTNNFVTYGALQT